MLSSKSVQDFMVDIFSDGLKEDMLIFETDFVKKYPKFSSNYLGFYDSYGGSAQDNE